MMLTEKVAGKGMGFGIAVVLNARMQMRDYSRRFGGFYSWIGGRE